MPRQPVQQMRKRNDGSMQSQPSTMTPLFSSPMLDTQPTLGYDSSTYELAAKVPTDAAPWEQQELRAVLATRVGWEKERRELHVYYYRINQTLAFPLPVAQRPTALPAGIPKRSWYPWLIWLLWRLDERWWTLHTAWRTLDDQEAGQLLQQELAALDGWSTFVNWNGEVGLPTGHLAGAFSRFLANQQGWDPALYQQARGAATRLLEADVWPWFQTTWAKQQTLSPHDIHNIPVIALVRAAELAQVLDSPHQAPLAAKATATLRAWWCYRHDPASPHTEGSSYDGFLMDSFTEWLMHLPTRQPLLDEGRASFVSLARQWIHSTLPGRFDLHAPLGDVEPEMPFWMSCLLRIADWYGDTARDAGAAKAAGAEETAATMAAAQWLLRRIPAVRLPGAALALALKETARDPSAAPPPTPPQEVANAVIMRTGWQRQDMLALAGLSRSSMSHLHNDGGHLIIGWQGRFWITDPGYQQYRPGEERDFTMGEAAHNGPIINGIVQSERRARLSTLTSNAQGRGQVQIDLTACYSGLRHAAKVCRHLWLLPQGPLGGPTVVVRDSFGGLPAASTIRTNWQAGAHLAWAFCDGWARLSDGDNALWVGTVPGSIDAMTMERHAGSRGPLTLMHTAELAADGVHWWIFCGDSQLGWTPPPVTHNQVGELIAKAAAQT